MPDNKKHHYVPKFYLRRFSENGKSINLWNISQQRQILAASLKNQCYRDYFYGKDQTVEYALAETEGHTAEIFRLIDKFQEPPPSHSPTHLFLLLYLLGQYGRSAYSVDALQEMSDQMMKRVLGHAPELKDIDLNKFKIELKEAGRYSVGLVVQNYPLLLDLDFKLLINRTNCEFTASDNPVVLYNQFLKFMKFGSNTGLVCKGLQIFLPVGPDKTLIYYDPEIYGVGGGAKRTVDITKPRDVYELNTLQMANASDNVYFRDQRFNIEALARRARPFRRNKKATVSVFRREEGVKRRGELVAASREDINTNLRLSFVRFTGAARRWEYEIKKQGCWSSAVVRNPQLCDDHREFLNMVKEGKFEPADFFKFLENKLAQS